MLSTTFEGPLRIRPNCSWLLAAMLASFHLAALAVVPLLAVSLALKLALGLVVLLSLHRTVYIHVFRRGKRGVRELVWEPSGAIIVKDGAGHEHGAVILPDSFAHPWAVVLCLRLDSRSRRALVLLPDSVPANVLRRLRMRLRLSAEISQPN